MAVPTALHLALGWMLAALTQSGEARQAGAAERPSDAWLPGSGSTSEAAPILRGPFVSRQVNVDREGRNRLGDAANEPSLAVDPRRPSRIAVGWRQFDDASSNFRQAGVGSSVDGGKSWVASVLEPGVFRSDPVLEANAEGVFYFNSLRIAGFDFLCDVFRSTDGGRTWGAPVFAQGGDKAWMAIDRTRGPGRGNLYCAWGFTGCCGLDNFNRSTDGGASFSQPVPIPEVVQFGTVAIGPDGEVYVAGVDQGLDRILVGKSTNAFDASAVPTFDFVRRVNLGGSFLPQNLPNPEGLAGQVWVAVDSSSGPRRGWVYLLASVDPGGDDPCGVRFARSTNGGVTWSTSIGLDLDLRNQWQWFGMLGCSPDGRLDVLWNDTGASRLSNRSELRYTTSFDGGSKWSPPVAVSPEWDSHVGWPNQRKIGDYYDLHSARDAVHVVYAATFRGEQDVYYLRIGNEPTDR